MRRRFFKKPFPCVIGVHSYRAAAPPQRYWVEIQCERCGKRRTMPLSIGHERGGPGGHS